MAAWLGPAIAGGASILSSVLGGRAQADHYDNLEQTLQNNYELALRQQSEQEALNDFIKQLALAPTTNLRGDRTFYEEGAGWQIDPSQYTENMGSLADALALRQMEAAGPIQQTALDARGRQQQGEVELADSLLQRMTSREPMTPTQMLNSQFAQHTRGINDVYDNSVERLAGRFGNMSSTANMIDDVNRSRLSTIRSGAPSLHEARGAASDLDLREQGNLYNQYAPIADRSTQTLPVSGTPEGPLMQAMLSSKTVAPQTIGQINIPQAPQQGVPSQPDWGSALAIGSIGDAASGMIGQYQSNQRWEELMKAISGQFGGGGGDPYAAFAARTGGNGR